MPTSDELTLVDTNVIVYAFHQEAEHHAACRALLDQAQDGQLALCVVPQVLGRVLRDRDRPSPSRSAQAAWRRPAGH